MFFTIRHVTRYQYSAPISESNVELRMQPSTEGNQRCLRFALEVNPRATPSNYPDHNGNIVHFFDIPGVHNRLTIIAESLVEMDEPAPLPDALPMSAWRELDDLEATGEFWEMRNPSQFVQPTDALRALGEELGVSRSEDPLTLLRRLNHQLFTWLAYASAQTRVDSPIDVALAARAGVCQDFAHIFLALARDSGIPCRYVSGYLYPRTDLEQRSAFASTHAWVEAWLPDCGWVGFDPTNDVLCGIRHIRIATGTDYADVPPARGVFKGRASNEMSVAVRVTPSENPAKEDDEFLLQNAPTNDVHEVEQITWDLIQQQQQQ